MRIDIEYGTQVRAAGGKNCETIEAPDVCTVQACLLELMKSDRDYLKTWLDGSGVPKPGLLVFVNDESPANLLQHPLRERDRVSLMTLVSGG